MGGSTIGRADHGDDPVMTPELYDPNADTWTTMCPMRVPRLYHSTALLLPDARVLTAGRDHMFNDSPYNWPERRVEIYSPPYLFIVAPRPAITQSPNTIPYSLNFNVTVSKRGTAREHQPCRVDVARIRHARFQHESARDRARHRVEQRQQPDAERAARRQGRAPRRLHAVSWSRIRGCPLSLRSSGCFDFLSSKDTA